jgi:hypothetical protein
MDEYFGHFIKRASNPWGGKVLIEYEAQSTSFEEAHIINKITKFSCSSIQNKKEAAAVLRSLCIRNNFIQLNWPPENATGICHRPPEQQKSPPGFPLFVLLISIFISLLI